ncbi:MAG TPA: hypothetical protein VM901_03665 [Bdellovibrionota bacterium]|jgi:hypothetical protein|nr:hypothetical protein [Bdellovibrionota bacterium]
MGKFAKFGVCALFFFASFSTFTSISFAKSTAKIVSEMPLEIHAGEWRGTEYFVGKFCEITIDPRQTFVHLGAHAVNSNGENNDLDLYYSPSDLDWRWDARARTLEYQADNVRLYINFSPAGDQIERVDWITANDAGTDYHYASCRRLVKIK